MKRFWIIGICTLVIAGFFMIGMFAWGGKAPSSRPPMVAGSFYPDNPAELRKAVTNLLNQAPRQDIGGPLFAVVAPHAGYVYSGKIAANAYAQITGTEYKRVVVIAPSHVERFSYSSVFDGTSYQTPLGDIPVDQAFARKLATLHPSIKRSSAGHGFSRGRGEHALEVQLPFLQNVQNDLKIVPIVMGGADYQSARALGVALSKLIRIDSGSQTPDTLIVASSDLSHFHMYSEAVILDQSALGAIAQNDYLTLSNNIEQGVWEACGGAPIVSAMIATERLGASGRKVLSYTNSGDVTGDKSSVVGYGSVALFKSVSGTSENVNVANIDLQDQKTLLSIARNAVQQAITGKSVTHIPVDSMSAALKTPSGAFVTLKIDGDLRGCIGFITPVKSLTETVEEVAKLAATKDPRFPPVSPQEIDRLEYEISVLSPFRRISAASEIQIGRDGLLLRKGHRQGLLLPQVPLEHGLSVEQFVLHTANKAGLSGHDWNDEEADMFVFSAFAFHDEDS